MEAGSSPGPTITARYHHPYYTAVEIETLSEKQRGKRSLHQEEKERQQACAFIEAVGSRMGFPRKTIATAQNLYHRFHLVFPRKDFGYQDVSLAAIYVSTKMHDTLKKPRDILMVSYTVLYPDQARSRAVGGDLEGIDPNKVEQDRQRLLAVERLILETISFNFTSRMPFPYVIKIGKQLRAPKAMTKLAWRLTVDTQRTLVILEYPPHVVALACIYISALLSSFERPPPPPPLEHPHMDMDGASSSQDRTAHEVAALLSVTGTWEQQYQARTEDLDEIGHALLDLLIHCAQNPLAGASPVTPSSPSPHLVSARAHAAAQAQAMPVPYKPEQLTRLKIAMREAAAARASVGQPRRRALAPGTERLPQDSQGAATSIGKNEGTVRFLFEPENVVMAAAK